MRIRPPEPTTKTVIDSPDPAAVRAASLDELLHLGLPLPGPHRPLLWQPGDRVALRTLDEIEARAAILNVAIARTVGMPPDAAMAWLLDARLLAHVTPLEWRYIVTGEGDRRVHAMQREALAAFAWLIRLVDELDPTSAADDKVADLFPDLWSGERYARWKSRILPASRKPLDAVVVLDLYTCLEWALEAADQHGEPAGEFARAVVSQRRWALAWAVTFTSGPQGIRR